MTLSNDGHMLAVALAEAMANDVQMTDAKMAMFLVANMAKHQGPTINPAPTIEVAIAATRIAVRHIVASEWQRVAGQMIPPPADELIGRILTRIDGNDPDQGTLPLVVEPPVSRLDALEQRADELTTIVNTLMRKAEHPADRMAAKLPAQWITTYQLPFMKWAVALYRDDTVPVRVARDCEFDDQASAASFGREYAHQNGYEFRD